MKDFDLTVIGGGAGGLNVASGAVQLGARVAWLRKTSWEEIVSTMDVFPQRHW